MAQKQKLAQATKVENISNFQKYQLIAYYAYLQTE